MTTTNDTAPKILDLPIWLAATGTRREFDSLGDVEVPATRYWGAQTQRSLEHFDIGHDRMPKEVYHAYGYVKKAAAVVNSAIPDGRAGHRRPAGAGRQGGPDRVRGRPAGLGRLDQPQPPAPAIAVGVHRHGRADVRAVRRRGAPGPLRRAR